MSVPLGLTIQRFGAGAPSGDTQFTITAVTTDGADESATATPIQDEFAPAQFINMSDDDELAARRSRRSTPVISLADGALTFGNANASGMSAIVRPVSYETWLVDTPGGDDARRRRDSRCHPTACRASFGRSATAAACATTRRRNR